MSNQNISTSSSSNENNNNPIIKIDYDDNNNKEKNQSYGSDINQKTSNPETLVESSSNEDLQVKKKKVIIKDNPVEEYEVEKYIDDDDDDDDKRNNDNEPTKVSFFGLFRYSTTGEKIMIIIGLIGAIGQGLTLPLMIQVMGDIIELYMSLVVLVSLRNLTGLDDIALKQAIQIGSIPELDPNIKSLFMTKDEFWHEFHKYMLYLGLIAVLAFVASFLMDAFLTISSTRQTTRIRALTFKSIIRQEIAWHEKTSPGELSSRIISDTILIENGMGYKLGNVLQSVVTFVACFILAYTSGWKLSLMMSIIIPILLIIVLVMSSILKIYTKKSQDGYAELGGIAQEAFSQIRTIVSFGTEQKEIDRYVSKLLPTRRYGIIKGHTLGFCLGLVFCVVYSSFSIAFIYGTRLIRDNKMTYGDVLNVFMGVMMGAMTLSGVGASLSVFSEATGAATIIYNIIERKPLINTNEGYIPDEPLKGNIEFQDVYFNYPSRPDVEILKGISFKCSPGQTVALVGASGSGKSTSVQLLERYYNKKSGRILIDGRDIEDYNIKWLRSQIGLVSQEPTLFDASVAENISINSLDASQEDIERVAKLANAHDFIVKLSNGYETSTGERGLQLSGGQKQRICIARALMKNPKILLLDEATSALDNQSEKIVQSALDSASSGRTTLVIAHRLSTVKNADLIIVLEKGTIIEQGTHEELIKLEKYYYNLVKNQEIKINEDENNDNNDNNDNNNNNTNNNNNNNNNININNEDEDKMLDENDYINEDEIQNSRGTLNRNVRLSNEYLYDDDREEEEEEEEIVGTTVVQRISSSLTLSRNDLSSGGSQYLIEERHEKTYGFKDMPWKRYFNINKPYWLPNILGFFGAACNGAIQPAFAFIFSSALNTFTKHGQDLIDGGFFWGMMFIVLGVCNFVFFYTNIGGFFIAGEYLSYELRKRMYNSMIRQEVGFFDTNDIGDGSEKVGPGSQSASTGTLTAKLATEASLVTGLNLNIGSVFQQVVTVLGGFCIAFIYGWKLTLILLCVVPFLFIGSFIRMQSYKTRSQENRNIFETSSKVACEAIISIKTVAALNLEDRFEEIYIQKLNEPVKRLEIRAYLSAIGMGFSSAIAFVAYMVGYWIGASFIEKGEMEFNNMFKVLMAIILTAMAVGQSSSIAPEANKAIEAFIHILEIIDRKSKINAEEEGGIIKEKEEFHGEIEFNNIRFSYPSRPKVTVLQMGDKKITIPEGKMCAFIGGSGCGKSTLLGLLIRWYDITIGSVKVDGEENKNYNIKWLRQQMGIVNQEPCLFNISIKENIKYGKQDATDEEIYEAGRKANIHDFIMSLPDKYDTLVGGMGTSQMSGGQKQRIAIARAIIRNPKILLLDEATSALDAESELIVQKALEDASHGRTTITIAHRLSTIKDADIICVLKEGRIIEMGNHEELMKNKGEYFNMILAGDGEVAKKK